MALAIAEFECALSANQCIASIAQLGVRTCCQQPGAIAISMGKLWIQLNGTGVVGHRIAILAHVGQ